MFDAASEFLGTSGVAFLLSVVTALIIFYLGRWLAKLLTRLLGKLMARAKVDETLIKFAQNLSYAALLVLVILAALDSLGVETTSFAAIIAAAGLAVGFALQGTLANFAAGVMIILFKPFKVGDLVEAAGDTGVIEEIQIFNTVFKTVDNVKIIVPNGQVTSQTIKNYSSQAKRRIDLVIGCGYGDDLKAVKAYLEEILAKQEKVLEDPAPQVAVSELGDNSVNFVVRPWVKTEDYWGVRFDLIEQIKVGFDDKGFNIPYPQRDVHLHEVKDAA
jgi:small conductance mechanosensitive channel